MKKIKVLALIFLVLTPTLVFVSPPAVKADAGKAKVYIVCLPSPLYGLTFNETQYDPTETRDGAIHALEFKEDYKLPGAHPKLGKSPPFYRIDYNVVNDWGTYKSIIESSSYMDIIVINTHGEITPVPTGYTREEWTDEIGEAMLKRRVTWVHTAGYPFYYVWYQGASDKETPAWREAGFKRLMGHINKSDVDCWPSKSQTNPEPLTRHAEPTLHDAWDFYFIRKVQLGRPLKASDFKNYTIMPIWGSPNELMAGAVIAFVKPSERFDPRYHHCFGAYVHVGTNQTFDGDGNPTPRCDYWRGYAGAAAAIWTEVQGFDRAGSSEVYDVSSDHTEWGITVAPVITSHSYLRGSDEYIVQICFGILGCMKTNKSGEEIGKGFFQLDCPPDCRVVMRENVSKIGIHTGGTELTGLGTDITIIKGGLLLANTVTFIAALYATGTAATILTGIGGVLLVAGWVAFFAFKTPYDLERGVEDEDTVVDFEYDPPENYTLKDGYTYGEFESIVFIELRVPMENREGWSIVPLDWHIGIDNTAEDEVVSTSTCTSIALYRPPDNRNNFETTAFFEDFEGDISDWSVGDDNQDPEADLDYWGIYDRFDSWGSRMYCAEVGKNFMHSQIPNVDLHIFGVYDKDMDAHLTRSVDVKPYKSFKLRYYLMYDIDSGDYLAVEYYNNSVWVTSKTHTPGTNFGNYYETPSIPNIAEKIRFKFHSDDGYNHWCFGAFIDNIQIRAVLPNDANSMDDAGQSLEDAPTIEISESLNNYAGYLNNDKDWYQFDITATHINNHREIYVWLNQPSNAVFNLTLHDKDDCKKAGPVSSGEALTYILSSSDQAGMWRIKIIPIRGFGQYDFDIQLKIAYTLTVKTRKIASGQEISGVTVWVDGVPYCSPVTLYVDAGTHTVKVNSHFWGGWSLEYTFDHWEDGSTNNPRSVPINNDKVVTAYYLVTCPTLFVWNGSQYVYETLLDIHAESDVTVQHQIQQTLIRDGPFYKLQLRELDNFTSHIDQVKLYAVDRDGEWHTCPLTLAEHNNTCVTLKLLFDDDRRVDLAPSETINLKFLPSIPCSQTSHFIFEINGHNKKIIDP